MDSTLVNEGRRGMLRATGGAMATTAAWGIAPMLFRPGAALAAAGYANGMTGGPTGFPGAERYQYNPTMPEGRAIEAAKTLKGAGKAPAKLVILLSEGAIAQLNKPFPSGAPTVQEVWERETGIQLEIVGVATGNEFTKTMQDVSTKAGTFDIYCAPWNSLGDLVEAGGVLKLDDFVARHKPEWDDPKRGYTGGAQGVSLLNKYRGAYYAVSLDGDFQTWVYRKDLFEDAKEMAAFKAKYGSELKFPDTWEQHAKVAEFFHRPDKGLLGSTDLRNQGWGYTNWYQRYCSLGAPSRALFDNNGKPLIDSPEGIKATQAYVDSMRWGSKDAISWGWPQQYGNMAEGGAAMTCAFSNMPKFLDNKGNTGSKVTGKLASALPPGSMVGGQLVRRGVLWFNISSMVSSQSKSPEAAYLLLQWLGSSRIYSWMSANPGGYFDPFQLANFDDALVQETYHAYHVETIRETIKRSVPSLNFAGATSFHNALDENLMAALAKGKTAEQAMADTTKAWERIARRVGEKKLIDGIRTAAVSWPTTLA